MAGGSTGLHDMWFSKAYQSRPIIATRLADHGNEEFLGRGGSMEEVQTNKISKSTRSSYNNFNKLERPKSIPIMGLYVLIPLALEPYLEAQRNDGLLSTCTSKPFTPSAEPMFA